MGITMVMDTGMVRIRIDFYWHGPFKKKCSFAESEIFRGFTDWHSHILPGVDDGVQTMDEALQILSLYEQLGIIEVWLTPHIMEDMPNRTENLKERFAELQATYKGAVHLHLAAEYMLDNLFRERLDNNDLLPLGEKGDKLLVETSYYNPPANLYGLLDRIKAKGYYPVLAHPERYTYMANEDYRRQKEMGVLFQANRPSFVGVYGKEVNTKARQILKNDYYNLSGTDIHSSKRWQEIIHINYLGNKVVVALQKQIEKIIVDS